MNSQGMKVTMVLIPKITEENALNTIMLLMSLGETLKKKSGIKLIMKQLSCYTSAFEFFPSFTTFDFSHESQANSAATIGLCSMKFT